MEPFTREDVVITACQQYGGPVCVDFLDDAMKANTLQEAVDIIVTDSYYWDGSPEL